MLPPPPNTQNEIFHNYGRFLKWIRSPSADRGVSLFVRLPTAGIYTQIKRKTDRSVFLPSREVSLRQAKRLDKITALCSYSARADLSNFGKTAFLTFGAGALSEQEAGDTTIFSAAVTPDWSGPPCSSLLHRRQCFLFQPPRVFRDAERNTSAATFASSAFFYFLSRTRKDKEKRLRSLGRKRSRWRIGSSPEWNRTTI